jgi:hypothetical protein
MLVILVAIDPVELQPFRDFESKEILPRPKGGDYLKLKYDYEVRVFEK